MWKFVKSHIFCSFHFLFLVFGHFWGQSYENTKILPNLCLQGKIGKTEKKWKENHATKVTKIPRTKRLKYGMNETIICKIKFVFWKAIPSSLQFLTLLSWLKLSRMKSAPTAIPIFLFVHSTQRFHLFLQVTKFCLDNMTDDRQVLTFI